MKRRFFLSVAAILLISLSYTSYTNAGEASKSAKGAIDKYIEGYLNNEFKDIATTDLKLLWGAYKSIKNIPKTFQEEELNKAINKLVHDLKDVEQTKKSYGSILDYNKYMRF